MSLPPVSHPVRPHMACFCRLTGTVTRSRRAWIRCRCSPSRRRQATGGPTKRSCCGSRRCHHQTLFSQRLPGAGTRNPPSVQCEQCCLDSLLSSVAIMCVVAEQMREPISVSACMADIGVRFVQVRLRRCIARLVAVL